MEEKEKYEMESVLADIEEAIDMLDSFEQEIDGQKIRHDAFEDGEMALVHYASPYYDPVYAHEYYMAHRKLKGRVNTSNLNFAGKAAARSMKNKINEERDSTINKDKAETSAKNESLKKSEIEERAKLREQIDTSMSKASSEVKSKITGLRENFIRQIESTTDPAEIQRLKYEYKTTVRDARSGLKASYSALETVYKAESKALKENTKTTLLTNEQGFDARKVGTMINAEEKYSEAVTELHNVAKYLKGYKKETIKHSDELMHHGVTGQVWGVRNGPPYPLDSSVSTGTKLKENITKTRSIIESSGENVTKEQIKAYKDAIKEGKKFIKKHYNDSIKQEKKNVEKYLKDAEKARNKGSKQYKSAKEYEDDKILPARILLKKAQKNFDLAKEADLLSTAARIRTKALIKEKKAAKYWMLKQ